MCTGRSRLSNLLKKGEELRIQGEMTGLLAAGKDPYETSTGLTEGQITEQLGTMASAGGYTPSDMEKGDLLKAAQKVAKMQTAHEQGLWSKGRYAAEVDILQRSLLNEYPHLRAEIGDAMSRAGVSGASVDYAYSQMEDAIKQEQLSAKSAKSQKDFYMDQGKDMLKSGFGTAQELEKEPMAFVLKYGGALQQQRMLRSVKEDKELMSGLTKDQASDMIQQTAQVNVARTNGSFNAIQQKHFPGTDLTDLPSMVNDPRYADMLGEVDATVVALQSDPLRIRDKEAFDKAHDSVYKTQSLLHDSLKDSSLLKTLNIHLELSKSNNLMMFRKQNPELSARVDNLADIGKLLPPEAVQVFMANDQALMELVQGKATGIRDKTGKDKQGIAREVIEAYKITGEKMEGESLHEVEMAAKYYADNAEYIMKNKGTVKEVEELYERIDNQTFAKALLLASQHGAAVIDVGSVQEVGKASLLKINDEVKKRLSEYKFEKGSLIVSPTTGLVQVKWDSSANPVDSPGKRRTRNSIEEEVKRMNRFIKGITNLEGVSDYSILSGQLISSGEYE